LQEQQRQINVHEKDIADRNACGRTHGVRRVRRDARELSDMSHSDTIEAKGVCMKLALPSFTACCDKETTSFNTAARPHDHTGAECNASSPLARAALRCASSSSSSAATGAARASSTRRGGRMPKSTSSTRTKSVFNTYRACRLAYDNIAQHLSYRWLVCVVVQQARARQRAQHEPLASGERSHPRHATR
jgi:hypothetical protein